MRRLAATIVLAALLVAIACLPLSPSVAAAAEWRSEQPVAAGIGVPVPLGPIGDLQCWQVNRCLAIAQGTETMPAGIYAYDGSHWYLYSTVCGGTEGRIAWAGPEEFWTISDQRLGQELQDERQLQRRSLCHFKDGAVVASYAQPVGIAGSYEQMDAAACAGPTDCWFAGEALPAAVNSGAFHLHWDGQALRAIPSLSQPEPELEDPARSVAAFALYEGSLYESVQVKQADSVPAEPGEPSFVHAVDLAAPKPFQPLFPTAPLAYGPVFPYDLDAFHLAAGEGGLWALAGAEQSAAARITALRLGPGGLSQLALNDLGPGGAHIFEPGDHVLGAAAEPGSGSVWVSYAHSGELESATATARLARIHADGTVDEPVALPGPADAIARKGRAGPIACPGEEQCWMATAKGWLFHYGDPPPTDSDPAMHVLITIRPPDEGEPFVPPVELPLDDSGAELPPEGLPEAFLEKTRRRPKPRALVAEVRQRVLGGTLLELSFTLRARAHVRLLAKRRGATVASTPRLTMGKGRHRLGLRLDPRRWPTKLDFQVHRASARWGR